MKNSTNKILVIALVLLLIANIALVFMMVRGFNPRDHRKAGIHGPLELMSKELNMTEEQKGAYTKLKDEHLKNIRPMFDSVRAAKTTFFSLAKEPVTNDSLINIYSSRIGEKQAAIDKLTLQHFRNVRNLFTPEQQVKFDELVKKMMMNQRKKK